MQRGTHHQVSYFPYRPEGRGARFLIRSFHYAESFQLQYGAVPGIFLGGKERPARKANNFVAMSVQKTVTALTSDFLTGLNGLL
jgi:hypothetical protein